MKYHNQLLGLIRIDTPFNPYLFICGFCGIRIAWKRQRVQHHTCTFRLLLRQIYRILRRSKKIEAEGRIGRKVILAALNDASVWRSAMVRWRFLVYPVRVSEYSKGAFEKIGEEADETAKICWLGIKWIPEWGVAKRLLTLCRFCRSLACPCPGMPLLDLPL